MHIATLNLALLVACLSEKLSDAPGTLVGAWDLDCKANGYAGYGDLLVVPSDAPAYIDSLTRSGYSSDWASTLSDDAVWVCDGVATEES